MAKKEAGGKSASQNDFLEPLAPENVTATDVGTDRSYNNGAITVTWTINALSPAADTYTITDGSSTLSSGSLPTPDGGVYTVVVTGLLSATSYTLDVSLTNSSGTSDTVAASSVTVTTVPQAPQSPSATSTAADEDIISWSNGNSGGSAITSTYFVSSDTATNPDPVTMTTNPWTEPENGGSTQSYTLYHVNANGTSAGATTGDVTTIAPFFPPFFPPSFGGGCIEENTLIKTSRGLIPAKDIKLGDTVYSVVLKELDTEHRPVKEFVVASSLTFENSEPVETTITAIKVQYKDGIIYFNGKEDAKYSSQQAMFAFVDGVFMVRNSGELKIGDSLIKVLEDGTYELEKISEITILEGNSPVYEFSCNPYHWFIAGGYLVHNIKI